ncbi:putative protein kinase [Trypanosoma conorhini]|uniref:Protein kinase domain-containing protein n=1 Tax=Trypanosoma conorhini TaxID=83891 RepID=A0A3R7N7L0_9TRYP|nr:putative protein kinase [Trypanosoma conorhini]RNF14106.1 putative protein kinase [Trypanosoma conorhini]
MALSKGEHLKVYEGDIIDSRFKVIRELGAGNFSKVYCCYDITLPRDVKRAFVAVKIIKRDYREDAYFERDMLEILLSKGLGGAAVCRMFEFFEWRRCPVFVMSIHGPSLRTRRLGYSNGVVTRAKLVQLAFSLLTTFRHIHFDCRMVHTDLKPENILLADLNPPKYSLGTQWVVCDFGSASLWRMDRLDADLISTRPYRAPEVMLGNPWFYAADMWSMGCILYEVAVGQRLFDVRDDVTHLMLMDKRLGPLPTLFTKNSKYSSKFFAPNGDFLQDSEPIRAGKLSMRKLSDVFCDDPELYDLIASMLVYDPMQRLTAKEALQHPIFDNIHVSSKTDFIGNYLENEEEHLIGFPRAVPPTNIEAVYATGVRQVDGLPGVDKKLLARRGSSAPATHVLNNVGLNPHPPARPPVKFVAGMPRSGEASQAPSVGKARSEDQHVWFLDSAHPFPEKEVNPVPALSHVPKHSVMPQGSERLCKMRRFPMAYALAVDVPEKEEEALHGTIKASETSAPASAGNGAERVSLVQTPADSSSPWVSRAEKASAPVEALSECPDPGLKQHKPHRPPLEAAEVVAEAKSPEVSSIEELTGAGSPIEPLTDSRDLHGPAPSTAQEQVAKVEADSALCPLQPSSSASIAAKSPAWSTEAKESEAGSPSEISALRAIPLPQGKSAPRASSFHPPHITASELKEATAVVHPAPAPAPAPAKPPTRTTTTATTPLATAEVKRFPQTVQAGNSVKETSLRSRVSPTGPQGAAIPRVKSRMTLRSAATRLNSQPHPHPPPSPPPVQIMSQPSQSVAGASLTCFPPTTVARPPSSQMGNLRTRQRSDSLMNVPRTVQAGRGRKYRSNSLSFPFYRNVHPPRNVAPVTGEGASANACATPPHTSSMFSGVSTAASGVVLPKFSAFCNGRPGAVGTPPIRRPSAEVRPAYRQVVQRNVVAAGRPVVGRKSPIQQEFKSPSVVSRAMQGTVGTRGDGAGSGVMASVDRNALGKREMGFAVEDAPAETRVPHNARRFPTVRAPE